MTTNELKITIIGRKVTIKNGSKSGKTFVAYSAIQNDGKWVNVGFTLGVTNAPKTEGKYLLTVPAIKVNFDNRGDFPKLWIKEITTVEKVEYTETVDEKVIKAFSPALPF